jgi:hypothetical protein
MVRLGTQPLCSFGAGGRGCIEEDAALIENGERMDRRSCTRVERLGRGRLSTGCGGMLQVMDGRVHRAEGNRVGMHTWSQPLLESQHPRLGISESTRSAMAINSNGIHCCDVGAPRARKTAAESEGRGRHGAAAPHLPRRGDILEDRHPPRNRRIEMQSNRTELRIRRAHGDILGAAGERARMG